MRILISADALAGLVGRLAVVRDELSDVVGLPHGDLGPQGLVSDALSSFERQWARRCADLAQDVDQAAAVVRNAVEQFKAADLKLAAAIDKVV